MIDFDEINDWIDQDKPVCCNGTAISPYKAYILLLTGNKRWLCRFEILDGEKTLNFYEG